MENASVDEVRRLQGLRLKLHRLEPSRAIRTGASAAAFIKERRIVLSAGRSSLPMLAEAITGRPIRGSWMADREVYRIYGLFKKIYKHPDVYASPLILGKETLIHASLGPPVARIAGDSERRAAARGALAPPARRLLDEVERTGSVRMDRWSASTGQGRKARLQLERELLVVSRDLHTERGYHTAIVMPWSTSRIARRFAAPARRLDSSEAVDQLLAAAVRSAVIAPEREVRRWITSGEERIEALISMRKLTRHAAGRIDWLTCEQ